ncbi:MULTISPECIES: hypothetical protein [unclassified Mycobacterium]|nr:MULTISPECIES: hypothetical protein [unclassified Mycobacterium]
MADAGDRAGDTDLLGAVSTRVMVGDGALKTQLQAADLIETKYVRLQSG